MPTAREMKLDARIYFEEFPWTYLQELIAEISDSEAPSRKKLPVDSMTLVNASLDLDADIITYPFDIRQREPLR